MAAARAAGGAARISDHALDPQRVDAGGAVRGLVAEEDERQCAAAPGRVPDGDGRQGVTVDGRAHALW